MEQNGSNRLVLIIFGAILILVAALGIKIENDIESWVETTATVIDVEIEKRTEKRTSKRNGRRRTTTHTVTEYDITCTYTANGENLTSSVEDTYNYVTEGDVITIRYNPENPSKFTRRDPYDKTIYYIIIGIGAVLVVLAFVPRKRC